MLYVIGDENAVFGFRLLGIEGQVVHSTAEARQALVAALEDEQVEILFLTASWANALREQVDHLRLSRVAPLLVEIPDSRSKEQHTSLRELVQRSLGIHLDG